MSAKARAKIAAASRGGHRGIAEPDPDHPKAKTRRASGGFKVTSVDETCMHRIEAPTERPQYSIYRISSAEAEEDSSW